MGEVKNAGVAQRSPLANSPVEVIFASTRLEPGGAQAKALEQVAKSLQGLFFEVLFPLTHLLFSFACFSPF